ncbi:MAG: choice-of-anchor Q domain-containing protein, partial [Moheibacter sp.]
MKRIIFLPLLFLFFLTAKTNAQDGTIDESFAATVDPILGINGWIEAIAVQADGKIIVGGEFTSYNGTTANKIARLNPDGTLDTTFATNIGAGFNANSQGDFSYGPVYAIAVHPNGKIVVGGNFYLFNQRFQMRITQLNPDGTLDTSFSDNVVAGFDHDDAYSEVRSLAIQPNGRIIATGRFNYYNQNHSPRIARLHSDGKFDFSFVPMNAPISWVNPVYSVAIQPNGKIIVGGSFYGSYGVSGNHIARLNTDGTLDTTFDIGTGFDGYSGLRAVAIQADGKIIAGGTLSSFNGMPASRIVRLNTNGTFDTTFNVGDGFDDTVNSIAIQADGKIIVGGLFSSFNGIPTGKIARLNTDGTLDESFITGGGFDSGGNAYINSIAIQADGKIIAGGQFHSFNGTEQRAVARLNNTEPTPPSPIIYVKKGSTGNGNSWENAFGELADALTYSRYNNHVEQIWVAAGIYKPMYSPETTNFGSPAGRDNAFCLVNNIKIYGGFAGNETALEERNWAVNVTVLSGDLDNSNTLNDNDAHHVVVASGDLGTAELNGFTITGGNANGAGGIIVNGNAIRRTYGGAMQISNASPFLANLKITGNSATHGGGISNYTASPVIVNTLFTQNTAAGGRGGALHNDDHSSPQLVNLTIADNTANTDGTIMRNFNNSNPVIRNSIMKGDISNNEDSGYLKAYSLVQGDTNTNDGNINGNTDPVFENPASGDYRLKSTSPCINTGDNTHYTNTGLSLTGLDLAGNIRAYGTSSCGGGLIDMGAFEFQGSAVITPTDGIVYVKPNGTGNGSSWECATGDLQAAIKATGAAQIWAAGGTYSPLHRPDGIASLPDNEHNTFLLVNNVKVYGGFAGTETTLEQRDLSLTDNASILDGADNATHVTLAVGNVGTAELNGFTLTGGKATGGDFHITVNGNQITMNHGGGMYLYNASPKIVNCIFTGNTAVFGAGIHSRTGSNPELINCTFTDNEAVENGGASDSFEAAPKFVNTLITGNKALKGGAMFHFQGTSQLINCTITGNTTTGDGEGVIDYLYGASAIQNSIIYGNSSGLKNAGNITVSYSLVQGLTDTDNGNINGDTDPMFVNADNGNYRLQACSPVVNTGNNDHITDYITDLDGNDRIIGTTVDMGAYEFVLPGNCPDSTTWDGTIWSNGEPDLSKKAIINGAFVMNQNLEACELEVSANGSLEIPSGFTFTVNGLVTNHAGAEGFVVASGGNLIQTEEVENEGAITVIRNSQPIKRLDYTLWSSPVAGQNLFGFSPETVNGVTNYPGSTGRIYIYEGASGYVNPQPFDENLEMEEGLGYLFRAPNNWSATTPAPYIGTFTGVPNNGNIVAAAHASNYTSIGNPYPSNITANGIFTANPGINAIYFWNNNHSA